MIRNSREKYLFHNSDGKEGIISFWLSELSPYPDGRIKDNNKVKFKGPKKIKETSLFLIVKANFLLFISTFVKGAILPNTLIQIQNRIIRNSSETSSILFD